mmetsp:Transcript_279/g.479  ORF Transcript_279/g.479 Transcript_279/m.479 type:complete len:317 (+) Transcript_279:648-1598(+)
MRRRRSALVSCTSGAISIVFGMSLPPFVVISCTRRTFFLSPPLLGERSVVDAPDRRGMAPPDRRPNIPPWFGLLFPLWTIGWERANCSTSFVTSCSSGASSSSSCRRDGLWRTSNMTGSHVFTCCSYTQKVVGLSSSSRTHSHIASNPAFSVSSNPPSSTYRSQSPRMSGATTSMGRKPRRSLSATRNCWRRAFSTMSILSRFWSGVLFRNPPSSALSPPLFGDAPLNAWSSSISLRFRSASCSSWCARPSAYTKSRLCQRETSDSSTFTPTFTSTWACTRGSTVDRGLRAAIVYSSDIDSHTFLFWIKVSRTFVR